MRYPPRDCMAVLEAMHAIGGRMTCREIQKDLPDVNVPQKLRVLCTLGFVRKVGRVSNVDHANVWEAVR